METSMNPTTLQSRNSSFDAVLGGVLKTEKKIQPIGRSLHAKKSVLYSMCLNISATYAKCNSSFRVDKKLPQRILTNPCEPSPDNPFDNLESNLICRVHDHLECGDTTYTILDILGTGTFGQVFRCQKDDSKEVVAVKVIKNKPAYYNQGQIEIKILKQLNRKFDPNDDHYIVRLLDNFEYKNHICQVFELLSKSLLDILTQNQFRGLPLSVVQRFSRQILIAMNVLQEANIIHCDLKPENILLCPQTKSRDVPPNVVSDGKIASSKSQKKTGESNTQDGSSKSNVVSSIVPDQSDAEGESANHASASHQNSDDSVDLAHKLLNASLTEPVTDHDEISQSSGAATGDKNVNAPQQTRVIISSDKDLSIANRSLPSTKSNPSNKNFNPRSDIKVIDFGSACFEGRTMYSYIQSRFYRAPEVVLGIPYNGAIDMWSLGCVCAEMFLGLPLFPGVSQFNQLCRVVDMLGPPPDFLVERGANGQKYFKPVTRIDSQGSARVSSTFAIRENSIKSRSKYRLKTPDEYAAETHTETPSLKRYLKYDKIEDVIMKCPINNNNSLSQVQKNEEMNRRRSFLDFLLGLLQSDPWERWTAAQAIKHPFILGEPLIEPYKPAPDPKSKERRATYFQQMQSMTRSQAPSADQLLASPQIPTRQKLLREKHVLAEKMVSESPNRQGADFLTGGLPSKGDAASFQHQQQIKLKQQQTYQQQQQSLKYQQQQKLIHIQQQQQQQKSYNPSLGSSSSSYGVTVATIPMQTMPNMPSSSYSSSSIGVGVAPPAGSSWVQVTQGPGGIPMTVSRDAAPTRSMATSYGGMGGMRSTNMLSSSASTATHHGGMVGYYMSAGAPNQGQLAAGISSSLGGIGIASGSYSQGSMFTTDFGQALFRPDLDERRHFQSQQQLLQQSSGAGSWTASSPQYLQQPVLVARQAPQSLDTRFVDASTPLQSRGVEVPMTSVSLSTTGYISGWSGQPSNQGPTHMTGSLVSSYEFDRHTGILPNYAMEYQQRAQPLPTPTTGPDTLMGGMRVNSQPQSYAVASSSFGRTSMYHVPGGGIGIIPVPANIPTASPGDLRGVARRLDGNLDAVGGQSGGVQHYPTGVPPFDGSESQGALGDADPFFAADDFDGEDWEGDEDLRTMTGGGATLSRTSSRGDLRPSNPGSYSGGGGGGGSGWTSSQAPTGPGRSFTSSRG